MTERERGRRFLNDGLVQAGKKPGQTKPQTPSGEVKQWKSPSKDTTPANRKKDS